MTELVPILAGYGLPGVAALVVVWLVWKLIDRGLELSLRIPPRRR